VKARLARNGQMLGATSIGTESYSLYVEYRSAGATTQMAVYRQPVKVSQATKDIRRMPRRQEPKKDVVSYDKSRGVASRL